MTVATIPLLHIENEDFWRVIIQEDIVIHQLSLDYTYHTGPLHQASHMIKQLTSPAIIIFDLRFDPLPHTEGVFWLLQEIELIIERGIEVFVISGYLEVDSYELLKRKGIPASHIYSKGNWDNTEDLFIKTLREACERLSQTISETHSSTGTKVGTVIASFEGMDEHDSIIQVITGKSYKLDIEFCSHPDIPQRLVDRNLDLYVYCPDTTVFPEKGSLIIREGCNDSVGSHQIFEIIFQRSDLQRTRHLNVLIYHRKHLMRLLEFDVEII